METVGLIIQKKQRILLQLRDDTDAIPYPNTWTTFGGRIEPGETPMQALRRELKEELNYHVQNPEFVGKFKYSYVYRVVDNSFTIEDHEVHEGQKAAFFDADEAKELEYAFHMKAVLQAYIDRYL